MKKTIYRGYHITYDPPPIPIRTHDWQYEHEDYDGPEDGRIGSAESEAACKAAIDEIEDCNHSWQHIQGWGGDASVYMGTFDTSFYRCKLCGDEVDEMPADYLPDDDPRPRGTFAKRNPDYD